jgi:hypothetical protein
MVQHALDGGYEMVGVCRAQSVAKLDAFKRAHSRHTRGDDAGHESVSVTRHVDDYANRARLPRAA